MVRDIEQVAKNSHISWEFYHNVWNIRQEDIGFDSENPYNGDGAIKNMRIFLWYVRYFYPKFTSYVRNSTVTFDMSSIKMAFV